MLYGWENQAHEEPFPAVYKPVTMLIFQPESNHVPCITGGTMIRLLCGALALLALSLGCAPGYYQTSDTYTSSVTDVDPSFYDYDPTLRHWFTAPYWSPNRDR